MEASKVLKILQDPEWHEESKSYTSQDTDLAHDQQYCWGCQLSEVIRERLKSSKTALEKLESYFELTRFSEEVEGADPNPEWDRGYQAAMAILRANK